MTHRPVQLDRSLSDALRLRNAVMAYRDIINLAAVELGPDDARHRVNLRLVTLQVDIQDAMKATEETGR